MSKEFVFLFFLACCPEAWSQVVGRVSACDTPSGDFTYQINDKSVTFSNGVVAATTWKWDFGDGNTSTSKDPSHIYGAYGNFNVCLTAFSGCSQALFCNTIAVKQLVTGVEEISDRTDVFPNPANDQLFVSFNGVVPQQIRIVTIEGATVLSFGPGEVRPSMTVDLSKFRAGIYFLTWTIGGNLESRKVIKIN